MTAASWHWLPAVRNRSTERNNDRVHGRCSPSLGGELTLPSARPGVGQPDYLKGFAGTSIALGARQDERLEPDYYKDVGGLLPSVAQPPLPLQEFLPGPPPLLHPP